MVVEDMPVTTTCTVEDELATDILPPDKVPVESKASTGAQALNIVVVPEISITLADQVWQQAVAVADVLAPTTVTSNLPAVLIGKV